MPAPSEKHAEIAEVAALDRLVHEPARLAILTALASCRSADFTFLQKLVGLTNGNASAHLAKLEHAGLVKAEKTFDGKVPRTIYRLTASGRASVTRHWHQLERLRKAAGRLKTSTA